MRRVNMDVLFQVILLGFVALLLWESRYYPHESSLYPQIIAVTTSILLLVSIVRHFLQKMEEKEATAAHALRNKRFLQVSVVIVVSTFMGFLGGFLLSILCCYVAYAFLQEDRSRLVVNLGIGMALTLALYIFFGWFVKVPLLRGWLVNF